MSKFDSYPVDILSITLTLCPLSRNILVRCVPMKPAPPVISMFKVTPTKAVILDFAYVYKIKCIYVYIGKSNGNNF